MTANEPQPNISLDTGVALQRLGEKLTKRPSWQQNYLVLLGDHEKSDPIRIKSALLDWLVLEFNQLAAAEISVATSRLMTITAFAPDLKQIQEECFAAAVQSRYGDPRQVFTRVVREVEEWSNGVAVTWRPVDAFLIDHFGARHLYESLYPDIEKRWHGALRLFLTEGEPDKSGRGVFQQKKETIKLYAKAKRIKMDFSPIRSMLSDK